MTDDKRWILPIGKDDELIGEHDVVERYGEEAINDNGERHNDVYKRSLLKICMHFQNENTHNYAKNTNSSTKVIEDTWCQSKTWIKLWIW